VAVAVGGNLALQHFPLRTRLVDVERATAGTIAEPSMAPHALTEGRIAELACAVDEATRPDIEDVWPTVIPDDRRGRLELSLQLHSRRLAAKRAARAVKLATGSSEAQNDGAVSASASSGGSAAMEDES